MNLKCKKCGHQASHPRYDGSLDVLRHACICGYEWISQPLDKGDSGRSEGERAKMAWLAMQSVPKDEQDSWRAWPMPALN